MKAAIPVLAALLIAGPAHAIERYTSTTMSCARIQSVLNSGGAAILQYPARDNPSLMRFDRYVANRASCEPFQVTARASVPSSDRSSCRVYRCIDKTHNMRR